MIKLIIKSIVKASVISAAIILALTTDSTVAVLLTASAGYFGTLFTTFHA